MQDYVEHQYPVTGTFILSSQLFRTHNIISKDKGNKI